MPTGVKKQYRLKKQSQNSGLIQVAPAQAGYAAGELASDMLNAAEGYICELVKDQTRFGFRQALELGEKRERS